MQKILAVLLLGMGQASAGSLYGALIVAGDGTFLGTCEGATGYDSISNPISLHGSQIGIESMYNSVSLYGGTFSIYSPYNPYSVYAPYLIAYSPEIYKLFTASNYRPTREIVRILESSGLPRITVNSYTLNAIDPDALRAACRNP